MRYAAGLLCALLVWTSLHAGEDQDRYEEQAMTRCAQQRVSPQVQVAQWERAASIRDLNAAFPGKLPKSEAGKNPNEAADWFALVSNGGNEWRKADAVAAGLGPMYTRYAQRLELGPAPSIKKDEFIRFAEMIINNTVVALAQGGGQTSTDAEADKMFRILDLNSDGELTGNELSSALRAEKAKADTNGDGRISKDEYREYFRRKVEKKAETLNAAIKASGALMQDLDGSGKRGNSLPGWFATLDLDKDGQISLFEWRKGGKETTVFQEMDLNSDGLLTKDEYLRFLKMKEETLKQKKREEDPP